MTDNKVNNGFSVCSAVAGIVQRKMMMVYMDFQMRQTQFLNSQKLPAKSTSDHFGSFTFSLLRIFLFLRFFFNQRLLKDSSVLFWLVVLGLTAL